MELSFRARQAISGLQLGVWPQIQALSLHLLDCKMEITSTYFIGLLWKNTCKLFMTVRGA